MAHSDLIVTLVAAVLAAFAGGFIAIRLGLPPIVGYLLAGVVIGPYTPGGSADVSITTDLAEVGIILLMFGVGLQFSIAELLSVRRIAIPGAVAQIAVATALGLCLTQLWGWSVSEGIIFGLALSVASTVVLLRTLEDRGLLDSAAGRIAVGWLIVEDLLMVGVLVFLPALFAPGAEGDAGLAGSLAGDNLPLAIAIALGQAVLAIGLVLVVGTRVIPALLETVERTQSRELFTLCVLAIALGVAFAFAELFGVSLALGAFLAGVVLNESSVSKRAAHDALPFRDAFAVLFFVSVGMLFEPSVLVDSPARVLAIVGVIVAGKSLVAFVLVSVLGHSVRTALLVSAALAQVGEFSFILAGLAVTLGELPDEGTSLILAGALISIAINPLLFRSLDWLEQRLPDRPLIPSLAMASRNGDAAGDGAVAHAEETREPG